MTACGSVRLTRTGSPDSFRRSIAKTGVIRARPAKASPSMPTATSTRRKGRTRSHRRAARSRSTRSGASRSALLFLRGRRGRRLLAIDVRLVPRQIPFVAVAHVARARDAMELVRVDHELRVDAEAAQRLIHLLPALHGHVEVFLAAEE